MISHATFGWKLCALKHLKLLKLQNLGALMWPTMIFARQEGLSARIILQSKTLAMDLHLKRQRTLRVSQASVVAKERMANASTVTRRDTLLVTVLSQERYPLTLILAKFLFPLMLWLLTHIYIGLLIQEGPNTSQETKQSIAKFQKGVKDSTQGMELVCKCRTLAPTNWNCMEDILYCYMMFSMLQKFSKTCYQLLSV